MGMYVTLAGAERFLIEFLRAKDDRFFGNFTVAQLTSVALVILGAAILARFDRADDVRIPPGAAVQKLA